MIETLWQDIRYALRGLRAKPGFTAAVILTLALGIGANSAMFSIVDRMLFRPPTYMKDPSTVHRIYTSTTFRGKDSPGNVSQYANFLDLAELSHSFSSTAGFTTNQQAVGTGDASREMWIAPVSASFFGFFDAPPVIGRYFAAAEDATPTGAAVTVLGHSTWLAQYGGRKDVMGEKVQIGPAIFTIIGVVPKGFSGVWPSNPPAYYIPITTYAANSSRNSRWMKDKLWWRTYQWGWMSMMARRRPDVSVAAANADLTNAYKQSYRRELVENPRGTPETIARPYAFAGSILADRGPNQNNVSKVATWVAGVSVIVLLIACANVANLLLARALRRRREIALRLALGVSRGRLLAQLLTESILLALMGGAAGLLVAQWGGAILRASLLPKTAPSAALSDPRTVLFTTTAVVVVGLLTGLAPILQARRANLTSDLKAGTREGTYHRSRTRVALLLFQAALSVMLLVGAGLFVRSLGNVRSLRLGFDAEPVLLVNLNMRGVQIDSAERVALRARLMDAVRVIPGVENASLQNSIPFWSHWSTSLFVQGIDTVGRLGRFELNPVSSGYFATMGTRILRGRGISDQDTPAAPRIMIVSEAMGKRIWPDKDPIGQCVRVEADTMPCTTVVGIAENIRNRSLSDDPGYYYYMPAAQYAPDRGGLFVRGRGNTAVLGETIRRRLQQDMPGASYITIVSLAEIVGGETQSWRLGATMFTAFGVLALALAAIGLYSVIAYSVAQRTHELGVRVALGAQVSDVIRMVVSEGFRLTAAGVLLGGAGALWAGRWVQPLLFNESSRDPAVLSAVVAVLLGVAVAASWIPARRAARVDPQIALRSD